MSTINVGGKLLSLSDCRVMAIVNVTDESFYAASRQRSEEDIERRMSEAVEEGADILDIGGCSTRPMSEPVDLETEWCRVSKALKIARCKFADMPLSLDTFRAEVARRAISEYGDMIINDVSGLREGEMAEVAGSAGVPYVLTHWAVPDESRDILEQLIDFFAKKADLLQFAGVKDIIIDPGFGFSKNTSQNWEIMRRLRELEILGKPVLAGVSRKTMIRELLGCTSEEALNGTTAANMQALWGGAKILRVHDVREAKEAVKVYEKCAGGVG